ncbi:hypothetical protein HQN60_06620 [Deefgea piscis]|uniref:Uncharacterized protein n=1 Tax=Deefgea piscis TaxID=2739061 RepID=A0A6M8SSS1_9NEIS|nr:hypothetical protein [Deefgea piscis]QKJ66396.1 hypothetical protein HQN60_06620 [Deefgea piscis]
MQFNYVKSLISEAITVLCTAPGDVRSRLLLASNELISLRDNHFPPNLLIHWIEIKEMLTKYGPVIDEDQSVQVGAIKNTLQRIKNRTGTVIAKKLFDLHNDLQNYRD